VAWVLKTFPDTRKGLQQRELLPNFTAFPFNLMTSTIIQNQQDKGRDFLDYASKGPYFLFKMDENDGLKCHRYSFQSL